MVGSFAGCCARAASGNAAANRDYEFSSLDMECHVTLPRGSCPCTRRDDITLLAKGRIMLLRCESLEAAHVSVGSKCEELASSISCPLYPLIADVDQTFATSHLCQ